MKILVADDVAASRRAIMAALRIGGVAAEIHEETNGTDALASLQSTHFDCAFLDFKMPGFDGLEVLRRTRAAGIMTPIIFTTGAGDEQTAVAAMRAGATDYLAKAQLTAEQVQHSLRTALQIVAAERRTENALKKLRENEQFNRSLLDSLPFHVTVIDRSGTIIFVNRSWENFRIEGHGDPFAASVGVNYLEVCHHAASLDREKYAPQVLTGLIALLEGRLGNFSMEYPCHSPDQQRWFLMHAAPLPRNVGGAVISHIDISHRRLAEQALLASESRFRRIFDANIVGVTFWDANLRITEANDAFLNMIGYTREDLLSREIRCPDITPEEYHPLYKKSLAEISARGVSTPHEKEYFRKDGTRVSVHVAEASLPESEGHGISLVIDLTEQKRVEEERRQGRELLESVIHTTPMAINVVDLNAKIRLWNPSATRIFGWTESEVLGQDVPFIPLDKTGEFKDFFAQVIRGIAIEGKEVCRIRKDGTRVDICLYCSPIRNREGQIAGVTAIAYDITESNRLKEQLLHSQRMESIGRLAGGVAHDFNNLLAIIAGYSEGILRHVGPQDPLREHALQIESATERGAALIHQLLAFSRGKTLLPRPLNLNEVVDSVNKLLGQTVPREICIRIQTAETLNLIQADLSQIEQVLMNLAINARDAMPKGGTLTLKTANVQIPASPDTKPQEAQNLFVRLSVTDTGQGMDEEVRARIFEPFFTTKEKKGTGLGLWIVYGIVERCGGRISVRSKPGEGTTVELLFPAIP